MNFCNRVLRVRGACDKYIGEIVGSQFHHMLWNGDCLRTLLDTLEAVGRSCWAPVGTVQTCVSLPGDHYQLHIADELSARQLLFHVCTL